ncbi:MAG: MBL fold metallo-hydrolase [Acidobacteria bacterium]|nr:MBL fold metallo-hydrolase [Acidobacteriota bacterium]
MITLASGVSYLDLQFLGAPRIIATVVLHGPGGVALIDPGPSSTARTLTAELANAGIPWRDVRSIALTHVHLDHAGVTGSLVREHPHLRVFVHAKGAPHVIDPSKLVASATRLWGDDMPRLWGDVFPVPAASLSILEDGERIEAGGRDLEVAYTPGHASHHVSFYNADTGVAFVGDTAGVRLRTGGFNMPPTPPPDIDLEAWRDSVERIGRWRPQTLFITHFGPHAPSGAHLTDLADMLQLTSGLVKASLAREGSDESREAWFANEIRRELRRRMSESDAHAYEVAGRFDLSWRGLARYWRKKSDG